MYQFSFTFPRRVSHGNVNEHQSIWDQGAIAVARHRGIDWRRFLRELDKDMMDLEQEHGQSRSANATTTGSLDGQDETGGTDAFCPTGLRKGEPVHEGYLPYPDTNELGWRTLSSWTVTI